MGEGYRHRTDRVDGVVIAQCPNINDADNDNAWAHLSFTVEYSDSVDTEIFSELMEAWPVCGECGAELDAIHQQEQSEVLD